MSRPRHPNKEIEAAVHYAESIGWTVEMSNAHAWAHWKCPTHRRGACYYPIWSTPRNCERHARELMKLIKGCDCVRRFQEQDDG